MLGCNIFKCYVVRLIMIKYKNFKYLGGLCLLKNVFIWVKKKVEKVWWRLMLLWSVELDNDENKKL